jgi:hypothetical protein
MTLFSVYEHALHTYTHMLSRSSTLLSLHHMLHAVACDASSSFS